MTSNYRGRLFRLLALHVNWMMRGLWKLASNFVDAFTAHKLKILGADFKEELDQVVDLDQLETKYGGELPDKENEFWPPQWN